MKRSLGLLVVLFVMFLSCKAFARDGSSFGYVFNMLAKGQKIPMPADLEQKVFEFVPIVKKGRPVTFEMGNANGEKNEQPVHKVTLMEDFEMQKTEVTQLQWALVMGSQPSFFQNNAPPMIIGGKKLALFYNRPVENISYDEVQEFIDNLNRLDKEYRYSLPTEAQWEYAARGETTTDYYFGNDVRQLKNNAWFKDNSEKRTHDIAQNSPNKFGLYDILGNVWELTSDNYQGDYYSYLVKNSDKIIDPKGPRTGSGHVIRGGGFQACDRCCRPSLREHYYKNMGTPFIGFRLVRTAKKNNEI